MNRGTARRNVFDSKDDRTRFLACLGDAATEFRVVVESYCLMGNHYHMSLWCPEGGVSAMMQHLSANYTRWYNAVRSADGPIFRARFHSVLIDSERQLAAVTRYIHRNPLDLGVDPETFRWSSYHMYTGRVPAPPWLDPTIALGLTGGADGHGQFVRMEQPTDEALATHGTEWEPATLREVVERQYRPTVAEIKATVHRQGAGVEAACRAAGLIIAADVAKASSSELSTAFGLSSPAAARMALRRARGRAASTPSISELVRTVSATLCDGVTHGV